MSAYWAVAGLDDTRRRTPIRRRRANGWVRRYDVAPYAQFFRVDWLPDGKSETTIMSEHDEDRRTFLIGAALTSAAAGAALVSDAYAKEEPPKTGAAAAPDHVHAAGTGFGAFFANEDAITIEAFTERLMRGAPGKPGARDAGVLNYIDLALAGAYSDLQDFYRRGLAQLDQYCRKTYRSPFAQLAAAQQDEVIAALEGGQATGFA